MEHFQQITIRFVLFILFSVPSKILTTIFNGEMTKEMCKLSLKDMSINYEILWMKFRYIC